MNQLSAAVDRLSGTDIQTGASDRALSDPQGAAATHFGGVSSPLGRRRIAIAVTKLDQGGSIDVAQQVAAGLRARGHDVEIWYLYAARHDLLRACPAGSRVILNGAPAHPGDYLRIVTGLWRALRDFQPDAVHGVMPLANVLALGTARLAGIGSRVASQHVPSETIGRVMRLMDRLAGCTGIYTANIAVSAAVRDSFAANGARYRRLVNVVPNGVDDRWSELTREDARSRLGLPGHVRLVGTIGRLAHQKNQAFLLDMLRLLPDVHLVIAGSGELEQDLKRKAVELDLANRVHFLGHLMADQVNSLLRALDLFLFPSLYEGMPLALIEAMSAGAAIIASDIPPNREVAGEAGSELSVRLLGIESPQSWASAARELLEDREASERLGVLARGRARTFTMDGMIARYEQLLVGPESGSRRPG